MLCFDDVAPAQVAEIGKEPTVALVGDVRIAVLREQLGKYPLVLVERGAGLSSLILVVAEEDVAEVHPEFDKGSRDVSERSHTRELGFGDAVKLLIKAKGRKKRKLNSTGKVKVRPEITYTPTGGSANTRSVKVRLIEG